MDSSKGFVLLLQEVAYHTRSYLTKLYRKFEITSVVHIHGKEELKKYNKGPIFDDRYLVIFENAKIFESNKAYLSFDIMFPVVHVETVSQLEDAEFICKELNISYKIFRNLFTRDDAFKLIQSHAGENVSDDFCKAVVKQVGLSPLRIITALGVCDQLGYTTKIIEKYVDRWVYPDTRKLVECLLGVPCSVSAVRSSLLYLQINRHWYRYVQKILLDELDTILQVYKDKLTGNLCSDSIFVYIESQHITRARVMFALRLFEKVSISTVFALREFIKTASLMEVALRLGGGS